MASAFDQDSFRGRDDDVGLNSATFNGGAALNTDWTQLSDTAFRVRFLIQETGTGASADTTFTLYYDRNSAGYQKLGTGNNYLDSAESSQYSNGATTTQVIGAGTYISGDSLGGVETDGNIDTGNVDVETSKEFELEWCLSIDGTIVSEGDTFDLRVRRSNGTVLDTYTRTPRITVTLPPVPDAVAALGKTVWENDHTTLTQWADEDYFEVGNIRTHPPSIQPYLVQQSVSSLRMKTEGGVDGGEFPQLTSDTIQQTISGLSAGKYLYEYYQVSHDTGTRTTRLLSDTSETEVLLITGPEAAGNTVWSGPHAHPFTHLGNDLILEVYYLAPATGAQTGIKDAAMRIREFVGLTFTLDASATATTGDPPPPLPPTPDLPASNYIVKLLHGPDLLDLQAGRYCVAEDTFTPPTAARTVTYGKALVGSQATAKERVNRRWDFNVTITAGTTVGEAERALRELQSFLNRSGSSTPLYIAYRAHDYYDYEPFFGLTGAYARYEVAHGTAQANGPYFPSAQGGYILNVAVSLVIKPQAVFLPQPSGQATGGIFEDYIGKADGRVRGTVIAEATTNKFTNPAFMHGTWNNGWTASVVIASENKDPAYILFGTRSAMIQNPTPGAATHFTQSINVGNTNTHVLSYYIKRGDGGEVTGDTAKIWYGGTIVPDAVTAVGDGWYRVHAQVTGINAATASGVLLPGNTYAHFVDGFQIEQKDEPTPFCHGDMLDCTWAGTKNASTSTRTAARLRYQYTEILNRLTQYTIRVIWTPSITNLRSSHYLFEDSDDDLAAWIDSAERYNFRTSEESSIQSPEVDLAAGTAEILHFTFDGDTANIYRNGEVIVTGTLDENTALPTYLYAGSTNATSSHLNSTIQGFCVFQRAMSAVEVLGDYTQAVQQATDGDRIDPLPWVFTEDGDNVVDNDNDGTLNNYCIVGGLMGDDVEVSYKLDSSNTFVLGPGVTWGSLPVLQREFDKDILTTGGTNTLLFVNGTGTADTDANGDAVTRISLSTSITSSMATAITEIGARLLKNARSVAGYFVAKDAGTRTNVQVQLQVTFGNNAETFYQSSWRTLATSDAFRPFITFELPLDFDDPILDSQRKVGFNFRFRRLAGASTENFDISHAIWLIDYTSAYTGDVGNTVAVDMAYARGTTIEVVDDAAPTLTIGRRPFNRPLRIVPETLNVLMLQHTADNYQAAVTVWTSGYNLEIEQFVTTPRFDIL